MEINVDSTTAYMCQQYSNLKLKQLNFSTLQVSNSKVFLVRSVLEGIFTLEY